MVALYILIALAAVSAFSILFVRTVLNAALSLIVCLLAIAGIYVVLGAEFLAVVQVLVYAGGILLLIIFGIMVTGRHQEVRPASQVSTFLLTLSLMLLFAFALREYEVQEIEPIGNSVTAVGFSLMTKYVAPFEIGGLLILVSMIGAMIIASSQRRT